MTQHHDALPAKLREAAHDRLVVAKGAITSQRHELVEQPGDIMFEVRTLRMAGDLRLLPRGQLGEGIAQQLVRLGLKFGDLRADIHRAVGGRVAQFVDPALQLGDRFLEIEEAR